MYWVSYYLQRGFELEYLLNLNHMEKLFFIHSMSVYKEEKILYDVEKLKAIFGEAR